jgi:hypothetical protein
MLEDYHQIITTPSVQRFVWMIRNYFPLPALLHIACGLRYRTTGELADKAWDVLCNNELYREPKSGPHKMRKRKSAIHYGILHLSIKAWEAREAALAHTQPPLVTPAFITQSRERLAKRKSGSPASESSSFIPAAPNGPPQKELGSEYGTFNQDLGQLTQGFLQPTMSGYPENSPDDWAFWNGVIQGTAGMPSMGPIMLDSWPQG